VHVVMLCSGKVLLTWLPPSSSGGLPLTSFVVWQLHGNGPTTSAVSYVVPVTSSNGKQLQLTVSGLTNGQLYRLNVTAWNELGGGASSVTVLGVPVIPAVPTPRSVRCAAVSATAVNVTWQVGSISSMSTVGKNISRSGSIGGDADAGVLASTVLFTGGLAGALRHKVDSDPLLMPADGSASGSIDGTADADAITLATGLNVTYTVTVSPSVSQPLVVTTASFAVVSGLTAGTAYFFSVTASAPNHTDTPAVRSSYPCYAGAAVPAAPTAVTVTSSEYGGVSVTWATSSVTSVVNYIIVASGPALLAPVYDSSIPGM
jgi:hypothetical protein